MAKPNSSFEWATNDVADPTTGINNKTALTTNEKLNGFIPAFVKPSRQKLNQALYDVGNWVSYFVSKEIYEYNNNGGVFIRPDGVINAGGASTSITFRGNSLIDSVSVPMISAITDKFDNSNSHMPAVYNNLSDINKDNNLLWSLGDTGGLRTYTTLADEYISLFLLTNNSGDIDFASDTDRGGANIKSNADVLLAGFTHLKRIAEVPYSNTFSKFVNINYGSNGYIYFGDGEIAQQNITTSSLIYVTTALKNLISLPAVDTFPPGDVRCKIGSVHTSGVNAKISNSDSSGGLFSTTGNSMIYELELSNSNISYKAAVAGTPLISIDVSGYRNPALYIGP